MTIAVKMRTFWSVLASILLMTSHSSYGRTYEVKVLSAVTRGEAIETALVTLSSGDNSVSGVTDGAGVIKVDMGWEDTDNVSLKISKDGYADLTLQCPCSGMTYALSPKMGNLDGIRIVLTWGELPTDLDPHLFFINQHVFWDSKKSQAGDVQLDVDDLSSYGPETITIEKKIKGAPYLYIVDIHSSAVVGWGKSRAKVMVYVGGALIKTYYAPPGNNTGPWVVFRISQDGKLQTVNEFLEYELDDTDWVRSHIKYFLSPSYRLGAASDGAVKPDVVLGAATTLNAAGEATYRSGDIHKAIDLYRKAIDLVPEYAQAYSNLGLAYEKAGNAPEAIWAGRMAIIYSGGVLNEKIRASSYFNIARIYEAAGQFGDALEEYQSANKVSKSPIYEQAIERMKSK